MFSRTTLYNTTERKVLLAANIAAAVGAMIVTIQFINPPITKFNFLHLPQMLAELFPIYFFAHLIWLFGIAVLGGPVWMAMHQRGLRHWVHAGLTGGVLLGNTCMALMTGFFTGYSSFHQSATRAAGQWIWIDGKITAEGWLDALESSLWISLLGVILGLVIWRIAYRRTAA